MNADKRGHTGGICVYLRFNGTLHPQDAIVQQL